VIAALANRPPGTTHAEAIAGALAAQARAQGDLVSGLEGFHRGYGRSAAIQSGLLRMWAEYEDRITGFLAAEAGTDPTPELRLRAAQLVAIPRTLTAPEMRALVVGLPPDQAVAAFEQWLRDAARLIATQP
jgi:hypothetical protein